MRKFGRRTVRYVLRRDLFGGKRWSADESIVGIDIY